MPAPWRINLGGEGEVPGVLNQQGRWVFLPSYRSSFSGLTFDQMVAAGHDFLIADNMNLPLPDDSFDEVITNSIPPVDSWTHLGPTVQSGEIRRILKPGGTAGGQRGRAVHETMTTFLDILTRLPVRSDGSAESGWHAQELARRLEPSPLRPWSLGDSRPEVGPFLLLGVAPWSGYDLRLLDVIEARLKRGGSGLPVIRVFNIDECRVADDFKRYIPRLGSVSQPPVAGLWRDGQLNWSDQGYAAREKVASLFGSSSADIVASIDEWRRSRSSRPEATGKPDATRRS